MGPTNTQVYQKSYGVQMISDNWILYSTWAYKLTYIVGLLSLLTAKFVLPDFLKYGKTLERPVEGNCRKNGSIVQLLTQITVPKSWFAHFYVISCLLSGALCFTYPDIPVVWLVLVHSLRRLYETLYVSKYSVASRMNWSHYLVGLWFYSTLNLIVFLDILSGIISRHLHILSFALFLVASWDQYNNHKTLAALVKYSLPRKGLFKHTCCPHYMDETLIYLSLLVYSKNFIWPLIWVVSSLSISALETQEYYRRKFPRDPVPNYAIFPGIL